jgi:2-polyprenyl-6-methoxyphenol hydroxylase-like FAD-dependent oxidoreductase
LKALRCGSSDTRDSRVCAGLQRLFAASSPAVAALRSAGLGAVNALPAARRAIVRYATGEAPVDDAFARGARDV